MAMPLDTRTIFTFLFVLTENSNQFEYNKIECQDPLRLIITKEYKVN